MTDTAMRCSVLAQFFTCFLPQLLQRWWLVCVGVFTTPSPSKEPGNGERKTTANIDIEAGIRPCSEVMDISASTRHQTISIADPPNTLEKSDLVSISMRSDSSIASISIDRTSANTYTTPSSLTVPIPITTRTPSIQIKVTRARTSETSSIASTTLPPHEVVDLFHGKKNNGTEEEIHNEKTRNRVSSQRQSIVDPVKARILDAAMKQVQDRAVGVHKKVIVTTPAIKITPSSVRVEYCQPPLLYSNDGRDKSSDTLLSKSDGGTESNTSSVDEEAADSIKFKRRGIRYIQPPIIFSQLATCHRTQPSMNIVVLPIILEPMQIPTPSSSVSGSSIRSAQSSESIQDIINMFPVPPAESTPSSPSDEVKSTHSLKGNENKYTGSYSRVTISPSSSSDSSSNSTLDISISSDEGDNEHSSVSDSVTSEGRTSPVDHGGEAALSPITTKRLDAYYPPGISGKSKRGAGDGTGSTAHFLFPALPVTPPRPQDITHLRKHSNHLRPSSGEWLAKYSKLSPSSQSGRDSVASQLSISVSVSVSGLSVFTAQYHDVVDTFNKAVEDNRRKGGAFHFNQDSLSALLSSSKEKQSESSADDGSSDEEMEPRQGGPIRVPNPDSKASEDEDDASEEATSETEFRYKSSLRKRPDSLLWFAALDEARAQEQAKRRVSAWETDLNSDLSDEEYVSTAALAVATPHQVEKQASPLNIVKKSCRTSSSSDEDASQPAESLCGSDHSQDSVSHEEDGRDGIIKQLDDEDPHEVSSDEWFSSDSSSDTHRRDNGQTTASVTTLNTPELDANDVFGRGDESLDSTERSIDDILGMLDARGSDGVPISGPGSPVDAERHPQITFKTEQRNLGSVSFPGDPAGLRSLLSGQDTESVGTRSVAPVGNVTKGRERSAGRNPWSNCTPVTVEDEEEDEDNTVEECWGDLFSEAR